MVASPRGLAVGAKAPTLKIEKVNIKDYLVNKSEFEDIQEHYANLKADAEQMLYGKKENTQNQRQTPTRGGINNMQGGTQKIPAGLAPLKKSNKESWEAPLARTQGGNPNLAKDLKRIPLVRTQRNPSLTRPPGQGLVGNIQRRSFAANNPRFTQSGNDATEEKPKKKLGIAFFTVLCLCVIKDLLDVLFIILAAAGAGLSATGVGAVVGIPLTGVVMLLSFLVSLFMSFILFGYWTLRGGNVAKNLIKQGMSSLVESIPLINILPLTTIIFVISHIDLKKVSGGVAGKIVSKTVGRTPVGIITSKVLQ